MLNLTSSRSRAGSVPFGIDLDVVDFQVELVELRRCLDQFNVLQQILVGHFLVAYRECAPNLLRGDAILSFRGRRTVLVEVAHRQRQRIPPERIAELARDHHLEHRRLALVLRLHCRTQRSADIR